MKTEKYTMDYGELTVIYEIEGDVDGNHAVILSIKNERGAYVGVDKETEKDIKFLAESEFSDLQFHHYMKTGETI